MKDIPDVPSKTSYAVSQDIKERKKTLSLNITKKPWSRQSTPKTPEIISGNYVRTIEKMLDLSPQTSKMPGEWKIGELSAIFKKVNRRSPLNYRPVSPTSIVCKLLESLVREETISHMWNNNLFSHYQYGVIDKRSTTLQLLPSEEHLTILTRICFCNFLKV